MTQERELRPACGNDRSRFGKATLTTVWSTNAMNIPSEAIRTTECGRTWRRAMRDLATLVDALSAGAEAAPAEGGTPSAISSIGIGCASLGAGSIFLLRPGGTQAGSSEPDDVPAALLEDAPARGLPSGPRDPGQRGLRLPRDRGRGASVDGRYERRRAAHRACSRPRGR